MKNGQFYALWCEISKRKRDRGHRCIVCASITNPAKNINIPGPSTFSSSYAYALKSFCKKQLFQGSLKCNGNVFHSSNVCYVGAIDITQSKIECWVKLFFCNMKCPLKFIDVLLMNEECHCIKPKQSITSFHFSNIFISESYII